MALEIINLLDKFIKIYNIYYYINISSVIKDIKDITIFTGGAKGGKRGQLPNHLLKKTFSMHLNHKSTRL